MSFNSHLKKENLELRKSLLKNETKWEKEKAILNQKLEQLSEMMRDMSHREIVLKHNRESLTNLIVDMKVVNDIRRERNKSFSQMRTVRFIVFMIISPLIL